MNPFESIARNLARCIVTGDAEGLRALFHSDATAWHNVTEREIDVDGIVASAQVLVPIPEFNYTDSKLTCFSTGVVIEHVVTGRSPNGAAFAMPACIVLEIENGLIRRLREWFDSVQSERARNPD